MLMILNIALRRRAAAIAALIFTTFCASAANAAILTGGTSRPNISTFVKGELAKLIFTVTGLAPGQGSTLSLDFRDEYGVSVLSRSVAVTADSTGAWTGQVDAPSDHYGFFRVFGSLADGTKIAPLGSRPAGFITYAVVPDPAARIDYGAEDSLFGMQGGFSDRAAVIPYLGVRWTSGGWAWDHNEPHSSGEFDEQRGAAAKKGETFPWQSPANERVAYSGAPWRTYTLATVNGVPKWAADPDHSSGNSVLTETGEIGWAKYLDEIGKAFPANYPKQTYHPYQLTWEPSYPWNWKGTDAQLVRIYEIGYQALHKADPNAVVIGPTEGIDEERLFKLGLARYLDGLSVHNYVNYPPERTSYIAELRRALASLKRYGGREIPIYGTEQGYTTAGNVDRELTQARSNVRNNLISLGEGLRFNYAFYVADYSGEPGYGYYYNLNPKIEFGADQISPKPTVPAYAAMTYLIDGHRPVQTIEWLGATSLGYAFQRGDDVVLALWDYSGKPNRVTIPVGATDVTLFDWMGNGKTVKASLSGQIELTLTESPIYVRGVSPRIWGRTGSKPLALAEKEIKAFPGQSVRIAADVATGFAKAGPATLVLEPSPQTGASVVKMDVVLSVSPKSTVLILPLPKSIPAADYSAKLTLLQNGAAVAASGLVMHVQPPVAVQSASPVFDDRRTLLSCEFVNRTSQAIDADAELRLVGLPGDRPKLRLSLPAKGKATFAFDCSDLAPSNNRFYVAQIKLATSDGYQTTETFHETFASAVHVAAAPSPDAALADWAPEQSIDISGQEYVVRSPQSYNGQLAAKAKLAWDEKNLYLAFDVVDPVYIQEHDGWLTWKGDCLQLEFNLDPGHKRIDTGNEAMDRGTIRTMEIDIALTAKGPQAYRTMTFDAGQQPVRLLTGDEAAVSAVKTASGLVYRIALPWKTLGAIEAPRAGQRLGFSAFVNDMNRPGQLDPTALGLFATSTSKDPDSLGCVVLTAK
ncbi:MAG: sugar-binding protein [Capsulimonadaceae bacterium]|nr:sugar-binding protein [Capsulimonadaceae bacterium]